MGTIIILAIVAVICVAGFARGREIDKTETAVRDMANTMRTRSGFER